MCADWIRKPGGVAHPLEAVLTDLNGPVDLPVATTVMIRAKLPGAVLPKINATATVVKPGAAVGDVDRGRVRYAVQTADLDTPGIYEVDFLATIPGPGVQVFPEDGCNFLLVLPGADSV